MGIEVSKKMGLKKLVGIKVSKKMGLKKLLGIEVSIKQEYGHRLKGVCKRSSIFFFLKME